MPYPTHWWMPGDNVDMITAPSDPPLLLSSADLDRFKRGVGIVAMTEQQYDQTAQFANLLRFENGAGVEHGAAIETRDEMPVNFSFFGVVPSGEAEDLFLVDDNWARLFASASFGFSLRGYLGSPALGYEASARVKWGDIFTRNAGDIRGVWDGINLTLVDLLGANAAREFAIAHGKGAQDPNPWRYGATSVGDPAQLVGPRLINSASAAWDGVNSGEIRVILSGAVMTNMTATLSYWNGAVWVPLVTEPGFDATLFFSSLPAPFGSGEDWAGVMARAIAAPTKVLGTGGLPELHWINEIEVNQFEPFVINRLARTTKTEQPAKTSPAYAGGDVFVEAGDLTHLPLGSPWGAPVNLRVPDLFWGYAVEHDESTILSWSPGWTHTLVEGKASLPAIPRVHMDLAWDGANSPLAVLLRVQMRDLPYFKALPAAQRYCQIFGFGDSFLPGDGGGSLDNEGMGLWWDADTEELVASIYSPGAGDYVEVRAPFAAGDYDGERVEIGFAWTGNEGEAAGFADHTLRVVANGETIAEQTIADAYLGAGLSSWYQIGFGHHSGLYPGRQGFRGLFGGMIWYEGPMTDSELAAAFSPEAPGAPFSNPSFETAASSGRAGEAEGWTWTSEQAAAVWAEFTAYVERYRAPWDSFEHLGGHARVIGSLAAPFDFSVAKAIDVEIDEPPVQTITIDPAVDTFENPAIATALEVAAAINRQIKRGTASAWLGEFIAITANRDDDESYVSVDPLSAAAIVLGFTDGTPVYGVNNIGWHEVISAYTSVVAAAFNGAEDLYESFEIWGDEFTVPPSWIGAPWLDEFTYLPGSFESTVDYGQAWAKDWRIPFDSFTEAWGNDVLPMQLSLSSLQPGSAHSGRLPSQPLTFPVVISASRNKFTFSRETFGVYEMTITPGSYATAADLVTELQTALTAALGGDPTSLSWGIWERDDGAEEGIWFGWDGVSTTPEFVSVLSQRSDLPFADARSSLGLDSFGPDGGRSDLRIPRSLAENASGGPYDPDEAYYLSDQWALVVYEVFSGDPFLGTYAVVSNWDRGVFDVAVGAPTGVDAFTLTGWTGDPAAIWKSLITDYTLTTAEFDHVPPNDPPSPGAPGYRLFEDFFDDKWQGELL